MEGYN